MIDDDADKFIRKAWETYALMKLPGNFFTPDCGRLFVPKVGGGVETVIFKNEADGVHGMWRGSDVLVEPCA